MTLARQVSNEGSSVVDTNVPQALTDQSPVEDLNS